MKSWKTALKNFITNWKCREEVSGILVCGSYITGNPSSRSDIDIHIILNDECEWRERGNQYVDGFLIEYFINPSKQIKYYFQEDFKNHRTMSMVQFLTGIVIEDKYGEVKRLIDEAKIWKNKQYEKLASPVLEIKKYELWDSLDNVLDCYEERRNDFELVYYCALVHLYQVYCSILCIEHMPYFQISRYFTDPDYLKKYLKEPFPDTYFSHLFMNALNTKNIDEKITIYKDLTDHVHNIAGGFNIDGWKLNSELSLF